MAFSREIKEQALVASARHCCVCHRRKGLNVEVHHIKPQADGGVDEFSNAIALCFDCHADAGHYFADHPKGTKLRPSELIRHRDEWYKVVASGGLDGSEDDNINFHSQYVVALNSGAVSAIVDGKFDNLPLSVFGVLQNPKIEEMRRVLSTRLPGNYCGSPNAYGWISYGKTYDDREALFKENPEFAESDIVPLSDEDINSSDGEFYKELIRHDFDLNRLGYKSYVCEECGGGCHTFLWLRRPIFVFLAIRNTSSRPIHISEINGSYSTKYESVLRGANEDWKQNLNVLLDPGCVFLIPVGVALGPSDQSWYYHSAFNDRAPVESVESAMCGGYLDSQPEDVVFFSPPMLPIEVLVDGLVCQVCDLNFDRLYAINEMFLVGSCPVIGFKGSSNWLVKFEAVQNEFKYILQVPNGADELVVYEPCWEHSNIDRLLIEGDVIAESISMVYGSYHTWRVVPGDTVNIEGSWVAAPMTFSHELMAQKVGLQAVMSVRHG